MNTPASQKGLIQSKGGKKEKILEIWFINLLIKKKKNIFQQTRSNLKRASVVLRVLQSLGQGDPLVNGAEEQRETGPRGVYRKERLHL